MIFLLFSSNSVNFHTFFPIFSYIFDLRHRHSLSFPKAEMTDGGCHRHLSLVPVIVSHVMSFRPWLPFVALFPYFFLYNCIVAVGRVLPCEGRGQWSQLVRGSLLSAVLRENYTRKLVDDALQS